MDQKDYTVELVAPDELSYHPDNPRRIEQERLEHLKESLTQHPDMMHARPLIALPDGTVIAGNMRLRAVRELGWETVPVVTVDLDETEARKWALVDNTSFGEYDAALLPPYLQGLFTTGHDMAVHLSPTLAGAVEASMSMTGDFSGLGTGGIGTGREAPAPPDEWPAFDESISTEFVCPSCGYAWSGRPNPNLPSGDVE